MLLFCFHFSRQAAAMPILLLDYSYLSFYRYFSYRSTYFKEVPSLPSICASCPSSHDKRSHENVDGGALLSIAEVLLSSESARCMRNPTQAYLIVFGVFCASWKTLQTLPSLINHRCVFCIAEICPRVCLPCASKHTNISQPLGHSSFT